MTKHSPEYFTFPVALPAGPNSKPTVVSLPTLPASTTSSPEVAVSSNFPLREMVDSLRPERKVLASAPMVVESAAATAKSISTESQ